VLGPRCALSRPFLACAGLEEPRALRQYQPVQKIAPFLSTGAYHDLNITGVGEDRKIILRLMRETTMMGAT
jgi:hypothetical protein